MSRSTMSLAGKNHNRQLARQAIIFALLGWPAADLAVVVGLLISGTARASMSDWLRMLWQVGLIGTLAGFALWFLYRLLGHQNQVRETPPKDPLRQ